MSGTPNNEPDPNGGETSPTSQAPMMRPGSRPHWTNWRRIPRIWPLQRTSRTYRANKTRPPKPREAK